MLAPHPNQHRQPHNPQVAFHSSSELAQYLRHHYRQQALLSNHALPVPAHVIPVMVVRQMSRYNIVGPVSLRWGLFFGFLSWKHTGNTPCL